MSTAPTRAGVCWPARIDPAGVRGPTPGQARGPRWRRVGAGLYVPADTDSAALEQRIVEAVLGCAGPAMATGWAGLAWLGGRWFGGLAPDGRTPRAVPVALGDRRAVRPRPGVQVTEDWLFVDDRIEVDGLPLTTPERSVTWEARRARTLVAAVQVIDMAAYDDLVDVETLGDYVARLPCRPGVVRLREALRWSDENAWSPREVAMRLCWRRERPWSNPRSNVPLFDFDGHHLLTPDLLDVDRGVAGEYDGAVHLGDEARRRDLDRKRSAGTSASRWSR